MHGSRNAKRSRPMSYFAYPSMVFWFIVPVALTLAIGLRARRHTRAVQVLGNAATVGRMLPPALKSRRKWASVCYVTGCCLWVIALAGPLLGSRLVEFKQKGLDVFIAVDCSLSM